jgi:hypothetical protein
VTAAERNHGENKPRSPLPRIARASFFVAVGLLVVAYGVDYCVFRYRVSAKRQPFGSVAVEHYTSIAHKDGKAELIFDPSVQKPCANALFPHAGDPPCWYLTRHAQQRTDI